MTGSVQFSYSFSPSVVQLTYESYLYVTLKLSVCAIPVDLGFIIDGSSSIERYGRGNFARIVHFIKSLISFFPIARRQTRVGLVLYTHKVIPIFPFNRYYTKTSVLRAIDNLRYPRGGTMIGKALRFVKQYFYR